MDQLTPPSRGRRSGGFTLVEVTVALGVLSFGLLAMLAMQIEAMRGSRQGRHTSQAAQISRNQMEFLNRVPDDSPVIVDTGGWIIGGDTVNSRVNTGGVTLIEQTFTVDWRIQNDGVLPQLKEIDVRVNWREPSDPPGMPTRRYAITSFRYAPGS